MPRTYHLQRQITDIARLLNLSSADVSSICKQSRLPDRRHLSEEGLGVLFRKLKKLQAETQKVAQDTPMEVKN